VGGAAIALAFDERRSTRDIDAVFEPKQVVYEAAASVGERRGFPPGGLNDAVKGFFAGDDPAAAPGLQLPGLRLLTASPPTSLALKALGEGAGGDGAAWGWLAGARGRESAGGVRETGERTSGDRLAPAARFFVEQVFEPK